jgi:hypothetical protein
MTFLRYFCLATNVRSFAKAFSLPDTPEYNAMMHSFRELFEAKTRGVLLDNLAPNVTDAPRAKLSRLEVLEDNIYQGLLHRVNLDIDDTSSCFGTWDDQCSIYPLLNCKAHFIHRIKVRGITYSTFKSHAGNSFVLFRRPTTPSQTPARSAGQVQQVFMHERVAPDGTSMHEPFLVVKEYCPLSTVHSGLDPFEVIEHLDAKLYYNRFIDGIHVLRLSDIVLHFCSLEYLPDGIDETCLVVRSLDRV